MKNVKKWLMMFTMLMVTGTAMSQITIPGTEVSFRLNGEDWRYLRTYKMDDGADMYLYCYTREVFVDAEGDTALPFLRIYVRPNYTDDLYDLIYERYERLPYQAIDDYTKGPGLPKSGGVGYVGLYTNPADGKDYKFIMTYFKSLNTVVEFRLETTEDTFHEMEFEFDDVLNSIK